MGNVFEISVESFGLFATAAFTVMPPWQSTERGKRGLSRNSVGYWRNKGA